MLGSRVYRITRKRNQLTSSVKRIVTFRGNKSGGLGKTEHAITDDQSFAFSNLSLKHQKPNYQPKRDTAGHIQLAKLHVVHEITLDRSRLANIHSFEHFTNNNNSDNDDDDDGDIYNLILVVGESGMNRSTTCFAGVQMRIDLKTLTFKV